MLHQAKLANLAELRGHVGGFEIVQLEELWRQDNPLKWLMQKLAPYNLPWKEDIDLEHAASRDARPW